MCSRTTKHDLGILGTLSFDSTLTIEFPHEDWAVSFLKLFKKSAHKDTCNPLLRKSSSQGTYVRLDLPESVDRVHFRVAPGAETHELSFTFDAAVSAQAWLEGLRGSRFWYSALGSKGDRLTFPLAWSHMEFASAVAKDARHDDQWKSLSSDPASMSVEQEDAKKSECSAQARGLRKIRKIE